MRKNPNETNQNEILFEMKMRCSWTDIILFEISISLILRSGKQRSTGKLRVIGENAFFSRLHEYRWRTSLRKIEKINSFIVFFHVGTFTVKWKSIHPRGGSIKIFTQVSL